MPGDDLRLNALSRYSKQSSEYVLETHSHCEVPAGCGGVVLRWLNPHLALPLEFWVYNAGEAQMFLDGVEPDSGRPLVSYGDHVLAWRITGFDPTAPVIACAATYDEAQSLFVHVSPSTGQSTAVLSAPDGTWRYTLDPPAGTWTQLDFDDSRWASLVARPFDATEGRAEYRLRRARERGAQPLGVEGLGHTVWIRKRFTLVLDAAQNTASAPQEPEGE